MIKIFRLKVTLKKVWKSVHEYVFFWLLFVVNYCAVTMWKFYFAVTKEFEEVIIIAVSAENITFSLL